MEHRNVTGADASQVSVPIALEMIAKNGRNGDELGRKYARQFADEMWRQCGTRVVILAAWKDANAEVCCTA